MILYIKIYSSRFYFAIFIGDISFHVRPKRNAIVIARDLNCTSNFNSRAWYTKLFLEMQFINKIERNSIIIRNYVFWFTYVKKLWNRMKWRNISVCLERRCEDVKLASISSTSRGIFSSVIPSISQSNFRERFLIRFSPIIAGVF